MLLCDPFSKEGEIARQITGEQKRSDLACNLQSDRFTRVTAKQQIKQTKASMNPCIAANNIETVVRIAVKSQLRIDISTAMSSHRSHAIPPDTRELPAGD